MCGVFSLVCLHFNYSSGESHLTFASSPFVFRERDQRREKNNNDNNNNNNALCEEGTPRRGVSSKEWWCVFFPSFDSGFQFGSPDSNSIV